MCLDENELIVAQAGGLVYEKAQGYLDYIIDANEEDMPNFLFRWFAGESRVWSPRGFGEYLITPMDLESAFQEIATEFGDPSSLSAQLANEIEAHITSQESEENGYEYQDARAVVMGDVNDDGIDEAIVLYTQEGANGGNNAHQRLAVFAMANLRYHIQADAVVAQVASYGNRQISTPWFMAMTTPAVAPASRNGSTTSFVATS